MSKRNVVFLQCKNCSHCIHKYCQVYKRPVDICFNKCKFHSLLHPTAHTFKVNKNLEKIMQEEEAAAKEHDKIWNEEENQIRKAI